MKEISETARKLINKLLDIDEKEGFVLLAIMFLDTEEMKVDALAFLENNPNCTKDSFFREAAQIKIRRRTDERMCRRNI